MHASGISVSTIGQWTDRCACTPGAWTTAAIGNTISAASSPCTAPESTFATRDQPDRARRLHAVLDLAGVAELLSHQHRDRLDALEHDRDPDDARDEHGGERRLGHLAAAAADPLADRGEHVEEHEHEQERLDQRADHELAEVLRSTTRSRRISASSAERLAAIVERVGSIVMRAWRRRAGGCGGRGHQSRSSLPGEVDEDGLEARLGDRQVGEVEAAALGRVYDPRHEPLGALDMQLDAAVDHARVRDLADLASQALGERLHVAARP